MPNYRIYNVDYIDGEKYKLSDLGILNVKGKIKYEELEQILENFIKTHFKELYNESIDLVIINNKTRQILHRFNLVTDLDNPEDLSLHTSLDTLESEFLYQFLLGYFITFGEEFDGYYKNGYYELKENIKERYKPEK